MRELPDRWFEELERRGIDPSNDDVPADFENARRLDPNNCR
ncbi:hypothetical protein [Kribbella antibiotica]|nr:hypothetical protein [Kribbella antibiotica]